MSAGAAADPERRARTGLHGAAVIAFGDVGSTNDEAMVRLRADGAPVWVTAERQLAGRGRRGRVWTSEAGNLYASLAFAPTLSQPAFGVLPLAAAVALADAVAAVGIETTLKWPNDVLVEGAKTAGILIETETGGSGTRRVVVGFGVNVAHHPDTAGALPATRLAAHRADATPAAVFAHLRATAADAFACLAAADGPATIRERWLRRAVGVGGPVLVRLDAEERCGTFAGLDADGRLILRAPDGSIELIAAGDVFVRSAA